MNALMRMAATVLLGTLSVTSVAQTTEPHYYAGLHAGTHDLEDWNGDVTLGANVTRDVKLELDAKLHGGFMLGREYENSRFEVEYQHGRFDIDQGTVGILTRSPSASGDYQALHANAYRKFHVNDSLNWYLGLGLGLSRAELPAMDFNSACDCLAEADDTSFSIQGRIGAEQQLTDRGSLFIQYTYLQLPEPGNNAEAPVQYTDKNAGALSVGFRFDF